MDSPVTVSLYWKSLARKTTISIKKRAIYPQRHFFRCSTSIPNYGYAVDRKTKNLINRMERSRHQICMGTSALRRSSALETCLRLIKPWNQSYGRQISCSRASLLFEMLFYCWRIFTNFRRRKATTRSRISRRLTSRWSSSASKS
jgi:hypothetical protein